jgi:hypothetical protein
MGWIWKKLPSGIAPVGPCLDAVLERAWQEASPILAGVGKNVFRIDPEPQSDEE